MVVDGVIHVVVVVVLSDVTIKFWLTNLHSKLLNTTDVVRIHFHF